MTRGKTITLRQALLELPLATQTAEDEFTSGLRELARLAGAPLLPALRCQSFPQTTAAVRSGKFGPSFPPWRRATSRRIGRTGFATTGCDA